MLLLLVHPEAVMMLPLPGQGPNSIYRYPTYASTGKANITLHSGYINRNDNIFNKGDSYVKVFVNEKKIGTSNVSYNTYYPQFHGISWFVPSLTRMDIMKFELWDKNGFTKDEYAGSITTSCDEVINKRLNGKIKSYFTGTSEDETKSNSNHRLHLTIQCQGF